MTYSVVYLDLYCGQLLIVSPTKMKPQRYLSIFFLIYSLLATSWLLASLWLHDSFTVALHDSHATFYFANLTTFTLSSILYWFLALQYHDKQKTQQHRSEERRVGKECRSRWSPDHKKKKKKEN